MPPILPINIRAGTGAIGTGNSWQDRLPNMPSGPNIGYYPPGANPLTGAPGDMSLVPPTSPYAPGSTNNFNGAGMGIVGGAGGGMSNAYGTGSYDPNTSQWNTGGAGSVSSGPGVSTAGGGGAVGTAGAPPGTQGALEELMAAYPERVGTDPYNTGSVTSDWQQLLQAFPQLAQYMDTEALLRGGAGDYFQPLMGAYSNDPFHVPGLSRALNFLLNLQTSQVGNQQQRSNEAEQLMRQLAGNAQWSSQNMGNEMLAGAASDLVAPGSLDSLEQAMRSQASEDVARSRMAGEQSLRDAGYFGQGGAGADPLMALSRSAGDSLAAANRSITGDIESLRGQRVGQASNALGTSTDIYRALNQDPQRALSAMLMGPQNYEMQNYLDLLGQVGSLETGNQIQRDASGGIEGFIASLLSPAVGAISGGAGNALTKVLFG